MTTSGIIVKVMTEQSALTPLPPERTLTGLGLEPSTARREATSMSHDAVRYSDSSPGRPETYVHGYGSAAHRMMERRVAPTSAAFLFPYLQKGMRVLDCGCGPGSVTVGLAEVVAPGEVVGIDSSQIQIDRASALAHEGGLRNVRFEVGDVYQLGFPDALFDVVFTQALLIHLGDRLAALREIRRVLKPGGIVGISDNDHGVMCWEPSSPLLRDVHSLWVRVVQHLGGDPYYARHQRRLLLDAGYLRTEGHVTAGSGGAFGTLEDTRLFAAVLREQFREPSFIEVAISQGWTDRAALETMSEEVRIWGERPDAFVAFPAFATIGWKEERTE
jgi:SAM-dependent methyltransferase